MTGAPHPTSGPGFTRAAAVHDHAPAAGELSAALGWAATLALLTVLVGGYVVLVGRRRRALARAWNPWRTWAWTIGATLLAVGTAPPLVALAHVEPRAHMAQHLLLGMYAPLGLVLGAPVTLLLGASSSGVRRRLGALLRWEPVHVLAHPLVAGLLTTGGLYVLYLTGLYAAMTTHPAVHVLVGVHLVLAGTLFAWSVAGPDPAPRRPGLPTRAAALVLAAAGHAYLAKHLYAHAAALPPGAPQPVDRMQQAAQWMYYGGDVAEVLLAVALFGGWYRTRARHAVVPGPVQPARA